MSVFSLRDFADHEQVVFCSDDASGLKAIIAVHNSHLGPALGGCRMWHYATEDDAIRDVLSEGVDNGGTTLRDYVDADGSPGRNQHRLDCYGRAGRPCHRCGTELRGSVVDARSTSWCPDCQRRR